MTEPIPPATEPDQRTDELDQAFADALAACLDAERTEPGSAAAIIQAAPESMRADLQRLLGLGQAVRGVLGRPTHDSHVSDVRARLMARIKPDPPD